MEIKIRKIKFFDELSQVNRETDYKAIAEKLKTTARRVELQTHMLKEEIALYLVESVS